MSDHLIEAAPPTNGGAPKPSSLLAKLNTIRDERLSGRTLDLPIPAWQGSEGYGVSVTVRALPFAELQPLNRRFVTGLLDESADAEAELRVACDALIRACLDVRVSTPEGDLVPLDEADVPEPCRFDPRTCALLGLPTPRSAREAVLLIFRRNEFEVLDAWAELQAFARTGQSQETERILGET